MFCYNCGSKLEDDELFCPNCGTRVEQDNESDNEPAKELAEADSVKEEKIEFNIVEEEPEPDEGKTMMYGFSRDIKAEAKAAEEKEAREREEREKAEKEAREKAEREAREKAEREAREKAEREAREKAEREAKENEPEVRDTEATEYIFTPEEVAPSEKIYCHECGTANDKSSAFCMSCGLAFGGEKKGKKKKAGKRIPIVPIIIVIVVIALIGLGGYFCAPMIMTLINGKSSTLLYVKDDDLFIYPSGKDNKIVNRAFEYCDSKYDEFYYANVQVSEDGNKLFYPKEKALDSFDLYYKSLKSKKDDSERFESDIVSYKLLKNGKIIYIKDYYERKLYISDFKGNKEKLDSGVRSFAVSDDESKVLWIMPDDSGYYVDTDLKNDKMKIDSDSKIYSSDDLKTIYYSKNNDLYEIKDFGAKNKIDSDISGYCCVKYENGLALYYQKEIDNLNVADMIIEDEYAQEDAKLIKPRIEDYQHKEQKDSFWGKITETVTDDEYYKVLEEYEAKLNRDNYRDSLSSMIPEYKCYELYYYGGDSKPKVISEGILGDPLSYTGACLYLTINSGNTDKISLNEYIEMGYDDREEAVTNALASASEMHVNSMGKDIVLGVDFDEYNCNSINRFIFDQKTSNIYLALNELDNIEKITLLKSNFENAGKIEVLNDEYYSETALVCDGTIYYFVDTNGTNSEFDLYADDKKIASDVSRIEMNKDEHSILVLSDINSKNEGTLSICTGDEVKEIMDDVVFADLHFSYYPLSNENGEFIIMSDYNEKKAGCDISIYQNGKVKKVDSKVKAVVYFN